MKNYAISLALYCCILISSFGKILNGYEKDISTAHASLAHLKKLPHNKNVLNRLETIQEYILYYDLTSALLNQFRTISPSIYAKIDTITDLRGRPVDVYVKFVPSEKGIEGTVASTNLNQLSSDEHTYVSEYGSQTVSITILTVKHSLLILAHEFGHVAYQVPNLSSYMSFFLQNYPTQHTRATYFGHKPSDPSGQMAASFERQFKNESVQYYRKTRVKQANPIAIRERLAKMVYDMK